MTEEEADKAAAKFDAADDKSGECFPSLETLAKRTHLNRSSVRRGSQCTPYQAHSEPTQGLTVSPLPGSQCTPIINITIIYHPDDHHPPHDAAEVCRAWLILVLSEKCTHFCLEVHALLAESCGRVVVGLRLASRSRRTVNR